MQSLDRRKSPGTPPRSVVQRPQSEVYSCQSPQTPLRITMQSSPKLKGGGQYAANRKGPQIPPRMTMQRKSPRTPTRMPINSPQSLQREGHYAAHLKSPRTPPRMTMQSLDQRESPGTPTRMTIHSPQSLQREGRYAAHRKSPRTPQKMTMQSPHSLASPDPAHCISPGQQRTSTKNIPFDSSTQLKQPEVLEASTSGTFVSSLLTLQHQLLGRVVQNLIQSFQFCNFLVK